MDGRIAVDDTIVLEKLDEVHYRVYTNPDIAFELTDHFKFLALNYKYHPKFKARIWDGYIRLFNRHRGIIYCGLLRPIQEFAKERDYKVEVLGDSTKKGLSIPEAQEALRQLQLPEDVVPYDFQELALSYATRNERVLFVSATASGKSLIMYSILRHYLAETNKKMLLIVPRVSLAVQLLSMFKEYAAQTTFDCDSTFHTIHSGKDKEAPAQVYISTWQSLQRLPRDYFKQFELVMCDEAHECKAAQTTKILEALVNCRYRFGFTGSLDGNECNELQLEGLIGSPIVVSRTRDLISRKILPELKINILALQYPDPVRKAMKNAVYTEESAYILGNQKRLGIIARLALQQTKNTLVIFRRVDTHGKLIYKLLKELEPGRQVYFVAGETSIEDREEIRKIVNSSKNAIIVASEGVFSTGINIRNLSVLIFAAPSKARIKIIQSIGRILRKGEDPDPVVVYDIVDDISWKKRKNFAVQHCIERMKIYDSERHRYKIVNIPFSTKELPQCLKNAPKKKLSL